MLVHFSPPCVTHSRARRTPPTPEEDSFTTQGLSHNMQCGIFSMISLRIYLSQRNLVRGHVALDHLRNGGVQLFNFFEFRDAACVLVLLFVCRLQFALVVLVRKLCSYSIEILLYIVAYNPQQSRSLSTCSRPASSSPTRQRPGRLHRHRSRTHRRGCILCWRSRQPRIRERGGNSMAVLQALLAAQALVHLTVPLLITKHSKRPLPTMLTPH
jgi:hypothetical protein